jgi:hypothetical protein
MAVGIGCDCEYPHDQNCRFYGDQAGFYGTEGEIQVPKYSTLEGLREDVDYFRAKVTRNPQDRKAQKELQIMEEMLVTFVSNS